MSRTFASQAGPPEPLPLLPPALRRPVAVMAVSAALVVLVLGVLLAGSHTGTAVDRALDPWLMSSTSANWHLAEAIDFAGEPLGLAALVAILAGIAWLLGRRRMAALVVLGTGLSITATSAIKPLTGRTIHEVFLSYPSGHTASATALAMIVVMLGWHRLRPAVAILLLLAVALVVGAAAAWAQTGMVAHYPSDTLGGWCTALAVVPATAWLVDHAADRWSVEQDAATRA